MWSYERVCLIAAARFVASWSSGVCVFSARNGSEAVCKTMGQLCDERFARRVLVLLRTVGPYPERFPNALLPLFTELLGTGGHIKNAVLKPFPGSRTQAQRLAEDVDPAAAQRMSQNQRVQRGIEWALETWLLQVEWRTLLALLRQHGPIAVMRRAVKSICPLGISLDDERVGSVSPASCESSTSHSDRAARVRLAIGEFVRENVVTRNHPAAWLTAIDMVFAGAPSQMVLDYLAQELENDSDAEIGGKLYQKLCRVIRRCKSLAKQAVPDLVRAT